MTGDSELFAGSWAHLDRARLRRGELAGVWAKFIAEDPFVSVVERADGKGDGALWIDQTEPYPLEFGLLFGEWLYHVRAGLDTAIYAAAAHDSGKPTPPRSGQLSFPVCTTRHAWQRAKPALRALSVEHVKWVDAAQPYHLEEPQGAALYWVNHLARLDRHRLLHVVGGYAQTRFPSIRLARGVGTAAVDVFGVRSFQPLVGRTRIARFRVRPPSARDDVQVDTDAVIEIEIPAMGEFRERLGEDRLKDFEFLRLPLAERQAVIESVVLGTQIAAFELSCCGSTREEFTDALPAEILDTRNH